jgi:hypothetical protein
MPVIPALRREAKAEVQEFQVSLGYIVMSCFKKGESKVLLFLLSLNFIFEGKLI